MSLPHFLDRAAVHDLDRVLREALLKRANLSDQFTIANAIRLPTVRIHKALDGHRDDDRAAKNIFDLPLGSVDR